jgi:tungstate transport system ATP-binding protein
MQRLSSELALPAVTTSILPVLGAALRLTRGGRNVIDGVDIELTHELGTLVILGPNGAGKSLLLRLLAGLVVPDGGAVTWVGMPPDRARAPRLGFVFQRPALLRRSAAANVMFALGAAGVAAAARAALAARALDAAGLAHLARTPARQLSGGEQQRLTLARALAMQPEVLFLDEPTSSLDPASTAAIEELIIAARSAGTAVVLVTHDLGQARRLADEVAFLHRGRLLERTPAAEFFASPATAQARTFLAGELVL